MLIQGDARFLPLADQSVQCVVTSPPYFGLRDYGRGHDGDKWTPSYRIESLCRPFVSGRHEGRRTLMNSRDFGYALIVLALWMLFAHFYLP